MPHSVLVVDDEATVRRMLAEILDDEGVEVVTAANGEEALSRLRSGEPLPCVILLDMMMPVMDGWELAGVIRKDPRLAGIPFAAIGANPAHAADARHIGAERWLGKPLDIDTLLGTIDELCRAAA